ncbi:MAG: CRISPR-associated endonuclease Cas2 [Patescibacteria group bacterium]
MKKYKRGEITKIIFLSILAVGFITVALAAPNATQLFKYFKPKSSPERNRIRKSVARLEKQGLIKQKGNMNGYFILTAEGMVKAMRYQIENTKIPKQKKWDGKWRLVMFDVPEEKKKARQAINYALKKVGCVQYQKSVFLTPFPCEKEVDFIGGCFNVREHIRVVVADTIEGGSVFARQFGI